MCTSSNGELTRLLPHFPVHRRVFTLHYEARRSNASSLSVGWNVHTSPQSAIYFRQGIPLDRSTLASWVGVAAAQLQPLHGASLRS